MNNIGSRPWAESEACLKGILLGTPDRSGVALSVPQVSFAVDVLWQLKP